jgi:hypothetical protein
MSHLASLLKTLTVMAPLGVLSCASGLPPPLESPTPACGNTGGANLVPISGAGDGSGPAFLIHRTEVTVVEYEKCVNGGACSPLPVWHDNSQCNSGSERAEFPVNCVTQSDAAAYCEWRGERLPTAQEWVWAAKSGRKNRRYPWGSASASCKRAILPLHPRRFGEAGCGTGRTWPVGSRPLGATLDGVMDMIGNALEWTSTFIDGRVIVVGGSYTSGAPRDAGEWTLTSPEMPWGGIRCVRDVGPHCSHLPEM